MPAGTDTSGRCLCAGWYRYTAYIPRMYLEKQELNAPHRQYVRNVLLWYSYGREDCLRIENRAICFLPVKAITSKVRAGPLAVDTRGKART